MTKTARAAVAFVEFLHNREHHLLHGHEYHLRDALSRPYLVAIGAAIPPRDIYLALVVRVDEAGQVAEHEAMLVAKT